jgi:hypothetical protein
MLRATHSAKDRAVTDSIHLKLPYLAPSQALKHITHNEALEALDGLVQLAVLDRDLTAPPADPGEGDRYVVGAAATGDWEGRDGAVAVFASGGWAFRAPEEGWTAYLVDEGGFVTWTGSGWTPVVGIGGKVPTLGVNTAPDATNRLAVKSDAVLLSHDDVTPGSGDLRLSFNKAAAGNTASLLFQTGFSGRAEIGTAGDDDLHVKVSPDGSTWSEALVIGAAAGGVSVTLPLRLAAFAVASLPDAGAGAGQVIYVSDAAGGAVLAFSDGADWRRVTDRAVVG